MQGVDLDDMLEKIVAEDPRYQREAYLFVREALDHTQKKLTKQERGSVRHVSGQELLEGIREFAVNQYGPMTVTLLNDWGICRCEDFGEIVFNLVERNVLAKTEKDTREDFARGYSFHDAFVRPFLPPSRQDLPSSNQLEVQHGKPAQRKLQ